MNNISIDGEQAINNFIKRFQREYEELLQMEQRDFERIKNLPHRKPQITETYNLKKKEFLLTVKAINQVYDRNYQLST